MLDCSESCQLAAHDRHQAGQRTGELRQQHPAARCCQLAAHDRKLKLKLNLKLRGVQQSCVSSTELLASCA